MSCLKVDGAFHIEMTPFEDDRGYFGRAWCKREFSDAGIDIDFVQSNMSGSGKAGTLRGLHYQIAPHEEGKLIRCIAGSVFDVVADVRPHSPTYKQWAGVTLSAARRDMLFVPPGCARGYLTLEENTELYYFSSAYYAPDCERGIRWDDPIFAIDWPVADGRWEQLTLSEKDTSWLDFSD
ncbi:MAG: dTDP-4-dehydrorhamnose 3,5-epimerase [Pseudomonadota bacterium]